MLSCDEIHLEIYATADTPTATNPDSDRNPFGLDESRGEIPVAAGMLKIDELKLRDLSGYPLDVRRRLVGVKATELQQLIALGVFALVRVEHVPGLKGMGSKLVYKIKYNAQGELTKDKARFGFLHFDTDTCGTSGSYPTTALRRRRTERLLQVAHRRHSTHEPTGGYLVRDKGGIVEGQRMGSPYS